jgi:hypothetical protein
VCSVSDDGAGQTGVCPSFEEFKASVLARQIRNAMKKGRAYCANLSDNELGVIEGKHRMLAEAAAQCRELLKTAREAHQSAQKERDSLALGTTDISVYSAYRNIAQDTAAWEKCFLQYYAETQGARAALPGGAHGHRARDLMVRMMISFKAAPGYSNHSSGRAVDFSTVHRGRKLTARKAQRHHWRSSWLHAWLCEHAAEYGFQPLSTEEWHWDYA